MEEILDKILSEIQNTNVRLENLETVHEDLAAEQGIIKKCLETLDKGQEKFTVGQGELKTQYE
ncbi:hypothetical protein IEC97_22220 [Neobacillus cucumis]|uniref:hypothetical protein n=1 Tax=Neobacillus cucumis TaxID=1740721 RepID=UPI0018DF3384|nr:hypothetical protein [Neobacillus cucumis]MBI0580079.1 hypothetical protein [Neobacillus cucumis]